MEPSWDNEPSFKHLLSRVLIFLIVAFSLGSFVLFFIFTRGRATEYQKVSARSGNWSNPLTWDKGEVPKEGENVRIRPGDTVTYDINSDQVLGEIEIQGTLKFENDQNTKLVTRENILVEKGDNRQGGILEIGTDKEPIHKDVKAQVIWRISQDVANNYVGKMIFNANDKGLWVGPPYDDSTAHETNPATLNVHGATLVRTWSKLAQNAPQGSKTIVVDNDVTDWYVGGDVIISATKRPDLYSENIDREKGAPKRIVENETRKITALNKVGTNTEITLDKELSFDHSGTAPYRGEVALLTRNVLFKTEIEKEDESVFNCDDPTKACDVTARKFAHIHEHHALGYVQYAEMKYMGHYAALSRYALHSHLVGHSGVSQIYRGDSMWHTGFRCINLHGAQGVLIEDNVCYDSVTTGYFVEEQGEPNYDYRFIHNFAGGIRNIEAADFDPHDPEGPVVSHELRQASGFWAGVSENAAFLGNVAASENDGGSKSAGYNLTSDGATSTDGTLPYIFIGNEVHGMKNGIWSWQNAAKTRDLVGTKIWRNGEFGIRWGAYGTPNKYFKTDILDNGSTGLAVLSIGSFIQDSTIEGRAEGESENGFEFEAYIQPQPLKFGNWIARNTFRKFQNGVTERHENPGDCITNGDEKRLMIRGKCSAIYSQMMANKFESVKKPYDFGVQSNANNMWIVYDYNGDDFLLLRSDQLVSANQTTFTKKLVLPGKTTLNSDFGGLVTRFADLKSTYGSEVDYGKTKETAQLVNEDDKPLPYSLKLVRNLPPSIDSFTRVGDISNKKITVSAVVTDDNRKVTKVEFFANWKKITTMTAPTSGNTYTTTIDLNTISDNWPQDKYAYLYAVAYDEVQLEAEQANNNHSQRAYSDIIELGPEVMGLGGSSEATEGGHEHHDPTPTSVPTTKTPTPTKSGGPPQQPTPPAAGGVLSDSIAPVILVLRPKTNEVVSGSAKFSARAVDNKGVSKVEFYVDGKFIGVGNPEQTRYVIQWGSKGVSNGIHKLTVRAIDTSKNVSSVNVSFTVSN